MVPFARAIANRNVTPARMMNRSPGKKSATSSASRSTTNTPMMNAAVIASAPMWMPIVVEITKIATSTRLEMISMDMMTFRRPASLSHDGARR